MLAISGIAVFLRFAVRISTKQGIRLSDWLILLSLMMMSAYAGVMIQCKFSHKLLVGRDVDLIFLYRHCIWPRLWGDDICGPRGGSTAGAS